MIKKLKKGFTLVELIVVIAIIAILSTVAVVGFTRVVDKANVSNDTQLVRNLNERMQLEEAATGYKKLETAHEAFILTEDFGFIIEKLTPTSSGNDIVWDSTTNRFALIDKNDPTKVVYSDPQVTLSTNPINLWKVFKEVPSETPKYSIYLAGENFTSPITTSVGLDVGKNLGITAINYTNKSDNAKNVVIRTNSANTTLTIKAPSDSVAHYGSAGSVIIEEIKTSSYHENGKVAFLEIGKGRIVLEADSNVEHIHIDKKENANEFDTIIIKDNGTQNPPKTITRDTVTVEDETLVVTVESVSGEQEEVFVYQHDTSGTTDKTHLQNTEVDTLLGVLVLDNGSNLGEKALSSTNKNEVQAEVVAIALDEERKDLFNKQNYWIGVASDEFAGGDGSEEHPYLIATAEQLSRVAYVMYSSQYAQYQNKNYKLTADIDLSSRCWVPIVTSARGKDTNRYFTGTFDGDNHTITGLNNTGLSMSFIGTMANDSTPVDGVEYVYGLFGNINGATIENVKLANVSIKNGYGLELSDDGKAYLSDSVGALVGYAIGTILIDNCHTLSGIVEGYDGVSGIIGKYHDETSLAYVTNCSNAATISATRRAAGILGNIRATQGTTDENPTIGLFVTDCSNSGAITSGAFGNDIATSGAESGYYRAYGIAVVNKHWYKIATTPYGTGNAWEQFYYAESPSFYRCSNTGTITNNINPNWKGDIAGGTQ